MSPFAGGGCCSRIYDHRQSHGGVRWEAGMHEHVPEKGPLFSQRLFITRSDTAIRAAQQMNVFTVVTAIRWGDGGVAVGDGSVLF